MNKFLFLTAEETMLLLGRVKNDDKDFETQRPIVKNLLLKLFSVFNELVFDQELKNGTLPVGVDEAEVWLMRRYIQLGDKSSKGKNIGVPFLRKIHELLIAFNSGEADNIEVVSVDEPSFREIRDSRGKEGKNNESDDESDDPFADADKKE